MVVTRRIFAFLLWGVLEEGEKDKLSCVKWGRDGRNIAECIDRFWKCRKTFLLKISEHTPSHSKRVRNIIIPYPER